MFAFNPDHEQRIKQTGLEAVIPAIVSAAEVAGPAIAAAAPAVGAATSIAGLVMANKSRRSPAMPALEKPAAMPAPDDDAMKAAKRRSIAALMNRSGRQSTFLSDPIGETLG